MALCTGLRAAVVSISESSRRSSLLESKKQGTAGALSLVETLLKDSLPRDKA